jgi:hypothetical protein
LNAGLLTTLLLLDDFFLIHEEIAPLYLGLSSHFFALFYALSLVLFLYVFKHIILQSNFILLLLSILFLGASVLFDVLNDARLLKSIIPASGIRKLLEDGCKLLGIVGWLSYFSGICFAHLTQKKLHHSA